jgi:hypothetical protein
MEPTATFKRQVKSVFYGYGEAKDQTTPREHHRTVRSRVIPGGLPLSASVRRHRSLHQLCLVHGSRITAFPVLARILTERNLLQSRLGTIAIACAAVDDVTGWCILAYIVLLIRSKNTGNPIWLTVGGLIAFASDHGLWRGPGKVQASTDYKKHSQYSNSVIDYGKPSAKRRSSTILSDPLSRMIPIAQMRLAGS